MTTKDLLGDPIPETPPMSAPIPWRVFQMNDCDWWIARSLDEALADYKLQTGYGPGDEEVEDARELTEEQLDSLTFHDSDEDDCPNGITRTFREELARRVAEGLDSPEMFASTET
jgi:hypothetical protein